VIAAGARRSRRAPTTALPAARGDWCHFATRLARSRTHRLAKGAERGFEDEKFAYAVLTRSPHRPRLRACSAAPTCGPVTSCSISARRTDSSAGRSRSATGPTIARRRKVAWGETL
jgi:hypothetical protein